MISDGKFVIAIEMIDRRIAVVAEDCFGQTALHYAAAASNNDKLIQLLCEKNIPDSIDTLDRLPFHIAAFFGNNLALRILNDNAGLNKKDLDKSLKIVGEEKDYNGITPLAISVIRGHNECIDIIIRAERAGNELKLDFGELGTLLHIAIQFGRDDTLAHLLQHHTSIAKQLLEIPNPAGLTPFLFAAKLGRNKALSILKDWKCRINARDGNKRTAMHHAVLGPHYETVQLLCEFGCKVFVSGKSSKDTPFSLLENTLANKELRTLLQNEASKQEKMENALPNFRDNPPENIVCQGGGAKGLTLIGPAKVLEEKGYLKEVQRVAGTSAGAIMATLLAIGCSSSEIENYLVDMTLKDFFDHPFKQNDPYKKAYNQNLYELFASIVKKIAKAVSNPASLIKVKGICEGNTFKAWIEKIIAEKTGIDNCTFGELRDLADRPDKPQKHLAVCATCVNVNDEQKAITIIRSEDDTWKDVTITSAVRASMSIPFVYNPTILDEKSNGHVREAPLLGTFVDGGLLKNFPLDAYDEVRFQTDDPLREDERLARKTNKKTLGFSLHQPENFVTPPSKVETVFDVVSTIVSLYKSSEQQVLKLTGEIDKHRVVKLSNRNVGTLEFGIKGNKRHLLIASGEQATRLFLEGNPSQPKGLASSSVSQDVIGKTVEDYADSLGVNKDISVLNCTKEYTPEDESLSAVVVSLTPDTKSPKDRIKICCAGLLSLLDLAYLGTTKEVNKDSIPGTRFEKYLFSLSKKNTQKQKEKDVLNAFKSAEEIHIRIAADLSSIELVLDSGNNEGRRWNIREFFSNFFRQQK